MRGATAGLNGMITNWSAREGRVQVVSRLLEVVVVQKLQAAMPLFVRRDKLIFGARGGEGQGTQARSLAQPLRKYDSM